MVFFTVWTFQPARAGVPHLTAVRTGTPDFVVVCGFRSQFHFFGMHNSKFPGFTSGDDKIEHPYIPNSFGTRRPANIINSFLNNSTSAGFNTTQCGRTPYLRPRFHNSISIDFDNSLIPPNISGSNKLTDKASECRPVSFWFSAWV